MNQIIEIELLDIIRKLIKQWKKILLLIVLGAIIGCALCFLSGKAVTKQAHMSKQDQLEYIINTASANLTDIEIENVKSNHLIYKTLTEKRQDIQKYLEASQYFKLQSGDAISMETGYAILVDDLYDSISKNIVNMILTDDLFVQINTELENPILDEDLGNMVTFETISPDLTNVKLNMDGSLNQKVNVIKMSTSAENKDICKVIDNAVQSRMIAIEKELGTSCSGLKIQKIYSKFTTFQLKKLIEKYTVYADTINKISSNLTAVYTSMSEPERAFYQVLNKNSEMDGEIEDINAGEVKSQIEYKQIIKYVFVFMILLPMIYCCIFVCCYIFDGKLHNEKVISNQLQIPILSQIEKEDFSIALKELKYLSQKNVNSKIGIVSSSNHPYMTEVLKKLEDKLRDEADIILLKAHLENDEDFRKLDTIHSLIIVENEEKSKIKEIIETTNYYKNKQIPIEGAIMVK